MMAEAKRDDISASQGVAVVYQTIRAFNEAFHGAEMPPLSDAPEVEQALASQAYVWVRDHPEQSARDMHNDWRDQMIADGWSLGEYDDEERHHPHICRFEDLPAWSKRILYLIVTEVNILAAPIEMLEKQLEEPE